MNGGGAGTDHRHPLVGQLVQTARGIAAGVIVIPPAGVKAVALERLDAGDARQLGAAGGAQRHHHKPRLHLIVAIGAHDPAFLVFIPVELGDAGLKTGDAVKSVMLADALRMGENLVDVGIFLFRDVAQFLQQRQIAIGIDIALRAGIAVPVPGAAEIAARFQNANVADAGLFQPRRRQKAAEPAADDDDIHRIVQGRPRKARLDIRVVIAEVRKRARDFQILVLAIGTQALVALLTVFAAQRLDVERNVFFCCGVFHGIPLPVPCACYACDI